ncbi:Holliday junction branch migration protein RuvA [Candidatus Chlamydia sanziniae]|uniref:Holliday junction branch migration complex subunit RuvA n=1 Tax=Candidatus Chlamydia sanziniae TaxID=1806891 RepID=A0A1A9HTU8_9CHLA|nr:Holliday junction branch migration protein RuvA [Candidatus Chlamydia sanziniae]ANH78420.1 Holliday junction DNA helicase RuvA [Candidatus Chlamydia sanziniae]
MYEYVRGILTYVDTQAIVIECLGLGYSIVITERWRIDLLKLQHQEILIYVHTVLRETEHLLYGFASREERECFRILLSLSGVGPKLALAILNTFPLKTLCAVVRAEDVFTIASVPGIGKKTAEKLMVDLKQKLSALLPLNSKVAATHQMSVLCIEEGIQALSALGYSKMAAERMILEATKEFPEGASLSDILPIALKKNS